MIELISKVRSAVAGSILRKTEQAIEGKIGWSRQGSKTSWLNRWLWSIPDHEYTREEAIAALGDYVDYTSYWTGREALKICDALELAVRNGLPLKLTVKEVDELRMWSEGKV